jgi:hypothetical protein
MKIAAGKKTLSSQNVIIVELLLSQSHLTHLNDTLISEMKDLISLILTMCEFKF